MEFKNKNISIFSLLAIMMLLSPVDAYAQVVPTLDTMFTSFTASSKALTTLVKYTSYIIGLFLIISGVFKFSQLGSNPQMSPKVPITMFLAGTGVFALTGTINIVQETMAMGSGPGDMLATAGGSGSLAAMTAAGITGVLYFIRLLGYVAFVRGWLFINQAGQGKEGVLSRGLTHLFGGVAAINIQLTAQILAKSFGWDLNL